MQPLTGILLRIGASFAVSTMGMMIKLVSDTYPTGELVFARSFFAIFPIIAMLFARGDFPLGLSTKRPLVHLTRVGSGVLSMFCAFAALGFLPLPDATAIGFAAPLFGVICAVLLLHEKVHALRWSAVAAGLAGVVLIFYPHLSHTWRGEENSSTFLGALLALGGAMLSALSMTTVRRLTTTEKTSAIVFYFSIGAALISLLTAPFGWVMPTPTDGLILVSIGLLGGLAQILLTQSYRHADTSLIAPFDYLALLWATGFSWLFFSQIPSWHVLAGGGIVIAAGILVILREHYLSVARKQERQLALLQRKRR